MAMPRFHTIAAFVVFAVSATWVLTGEFSSIGSAAKVAGETTAENPAPEAEVSRTLRTVGVITPDFIEHNRIIRVSGVTAPDKRSTLATRSAGILGELRVEKGDLVEAGEVILVLEGNERGAMVETAQALLDQRQKEMENAERLVKEGIVPSTQADNARSALASARSQLETAQADVDRLTVVAPFSGVIDQVLVEEGAGCLRARRSQCCCSLIPWSHLVRSANATLPMCRLGAKPMSADQRRCRLGPGAPYQS
jgi:multidrug efflux system membrane fusion protein